MPDNPTTTPTDETEEWRDVPGYEGFYSVSSFGRVRRDARGPHTRPGRMKKQHLNPHGYWQTMLSRPDAADRCVRVHSLVAAAFIGPRPDGYHINHIDACKTNNHLSNLEYVTPRENKHHARDMGLLPRGDSHWRNRIPERGARGETHGNAKFTEQDVQDIRMALANGEKGKDIAVRYGVSPTAISRINKGHTWHHVD